MNVKKYYLYSNFKINSIFQAIIFYKSDGVNLPCQLSNINNIIIDNIIPGKDYIVDIIVEHSGELKLANGFDNIVESDNKELLSEKTRKDVKNSQSFSS